LRLLQPVKGHRAGSDAVLLASAIPELGAGPLSDFGAGVGTIGLAVALRQPALEVVLVERDPELAALAARNAGLNGLDGRVRVAVGTIGERNADLAREGLAAASMAWVAMNPPFFEAGEVRASPVANRRVAHVAGQSLGDWLKAARHVLKPGGGISIIHRAEALGVILAGLETGFGAVEIRPVHGQADRAAIRVIVSARLAAKNRQLCCRLLFSTVRMGASPLSAKRSIVARPCSPETAPQRQMRRSRTTQPQPSQ
jgi:tRNA1(Val) A37 N6-methylase TrmN6